METGASISMTSCNIAASVFGRDEDEEGEAAFQFSQSNIDVLIVNWGHVIGGTAYVSLQAICSVACEVLGRLTDGS